MGKIYKGLFMTEEEIQESLKKPLPEPEELLSEDEIQLIDYFVTGELDLPEDNLLQKRYKENKRKEYEEQFEDLWKGLRGDYIRERLAELGIDEEEFEAEDIED